MLWDRGFAATRLVSRLSPIFSPGLYTLSAASECALPCAGEGWLAIGDAAQAHDPLSGQGITKAITSALQAAELIGGELAADRDAINEFAAARRHEFKIYLAIQRSHYGGEKRWAQHVFWQRRGSTAAAAPARTRSSVARCNPGYETIKAWLLRAILGGAE
jgi:flavin-dependent dehydrogenase